MIVLRHTARGLLPGIALAMSLSATSASAQTSRAGLVDSAQVLIDNFSERQSIGVLRRALDPTLGAPDAPWARAVQLLGQTLLQTSQREEALAWFRWALRQSPSLQVDSVNFTPAVVRAFSEARAYVAASRREPRATVRFLWGTSVTTGGLGEIVVDRADSASAPMQVFVNEESLLEKQARRLPAGSYRFSARAAGQTDAEFTAEVLPGVTTLVTLRFAPEVRVVAVAPPAAMPSTRGTPTPTTPITAPVAKRRSRVLPIMGGVAVAGLAAMFARPKSGGDGAPSSTGGIVVVLP